MIRERIRNWVLKVVGGINPDAGYRAFGEWLTDQGTQQIPTNPAMILKTYRSWIYVCCNKNATAVASVPLRLYAAASRNEEKFYTRTRRVSHEVKMELKSRPHLVKALAGAETVVEIQEHPFLNLMDEVNEGMNGYDAMELTQTFLEMVGNSYWLIKQDRLGIPEAFYVLLSQYMAPVREKDGTLKYWKYGVGTNERQYKVDEILQFMMASPLWSLSGYGPGHAAYVAAIKQKKLEEIETAIFDNRALPGALLVPKAPLTEGQAKQLTDSWETKMKGTTKAGQMAVAPIPMELLKLAVSADELTRLADPKLIKEEISAVFGVPLTKLDLSSADAAAVQGDITYMRDTVFPRLRRLEGKLNEKLIPMYARRNGVKLFCAYDSPLPVDRNYELQRAMAMANTGGIIMANEARNAFGLKPLDEMDEIIVVKPQGQIVLGGGPEAREVEIPDWNLKRVSPGRDKKLRNILGDLFKEQETEVLGKIPTKLLMRAGMKASPIEFFDFEKWVRRFQDATEPELEKDLLRGMQRGLEALPAGIVIDFNLTNPAVEAFMRDYSYRFSFSINETTQQTLREMFVGAYQEGLTREELTGQIESYFDFSERFRAARIERTEMSRAVHAGETESWRQSDVVQGSYWQANPDACEFCKAMEERYGEDGEMVGLGQNYASQGSMIVGASGRSLLLDYSDVPAPPLHPSCNCVRIVVLKGE